MLLQPTKDISLFPVLIYEYDLRDFYDKEEIKKYCYENIVNGKTGPWGVMPGTISSVGVDNPLVGPRNETVLDDFPELKKIIMGCVNEYARKAGFKSQKPGNSWFNLAPENGSVIPHKHNNCSISCTFYPIFPEGSANLIVHKPIRENLMPKNQFFASHRGMDTEYNISQYELPIKEGHAYVWPAWLVHSTENNMSDERIVIALNTVNK